jgi:capsid portal protein
MGGIKIVKSNRKHKKYVAVVDGKMVHFGDTRYGQYKDQIGVYSGKDHGSKSKRAAYFKRHSGVDSKAAALAKEFKNAGHHTAKTLSHTYLW